MRFGVDIQGNFQDSPTPERQALFSAIPTTTGIPGSRRFDLHPETMVI
jgi:hypothetical protein